MARCAKRFSGEDTVLSIKDVLAVHGGKVNISVTAHSRWELTWTRGSGRLKQHLTADTFEELEATFTYLFGDSTEAPRAV